MKVLLEDQFAPITSVAGFFEAPLEVVGVALYRWSMSLKKAVKMVALMDPFPEILHRLEPLTIPGIQRELLISTRSSWTAYFNNHLLGTDAFSRVSHLCTILNCRGLIVKCIPHTIHHSPENVVCGRFATVSFELFGPEPTDWLNCIRLVTVAADVGRWEFRTIGTVQPFEHPDRYAARRTRDRFTPEMLDEYCQALGVRYFDPDFYGSNSLLLENTERLPRSARVLSLAEVQRELSVSPSPV